MEEDKKRSKVGIIIGIIVLLLLIAAGVTWYIIANMDKNKPDEVLTQYFSYLSNKDYEGMYSLLSETTKSRVDKETYLAR